MVGMMRVSFLVVLAAFAAVPVIGQVADSTTSSGGAAPVALSPYTAEYKITTVKTLADGKTTTSESSEVHAVDSRGRRMGTYTASSADGLKRTDFQTSDPVDHTLNYWSVPGTRATVVHAPDVGEDTECSRKMKAISPLHPVGMAQSPITDLGTDTVLGIAVHGGRVSFTPSIVRYGEEPHARTNEVWTATDPSLDGLIVRLTTDGGPAGKSTRELVKFTPGEPDPALFQMPAGRTITSRNGQAYYCDVKPKTLPTTAPTAQHPTP
jgi:hypothetical protein